MGVAHRAPSIPLADVEIFRDLIERHGEGFHVPLPVEGLEHFELALTRSGSRALATFWVRDVPVTMSALARVYQVSCGRSLRIAAFPYVFWMICAARVYRLTGQ